jgi:hypothetical protein
MDDDGITTQEREPRPLAQWVDDSAVALAFYGSIVYLAVVSSLGSQADPPPPSEAIASTVAAASVLYVAHVFAAIVPQVARAGRLHVRRLGEAMRHDMPLLLTALVPITPLCLAAVRWVSSGTGYRLGVRLTMAMLFGFAVGLGRRDGLSWPRSTIAGIAIVAVMTILIWLESRVH